MELVINQMVSIRTDLKRRKKDVKQTVVEASRLTLYEIVYQSLFTDKLSLRARAKEITARLKQENI